MSDIDDLRHESCRRAALLLTHGFPDDALAHLMWSVERQARLAGLGDVCLRGAA